MRIPPIGSIPEILTALRARLRRELPGLERRLALLAARLGPPLERIRPVLRREALRVKADAERIRRGDRSFWGSRLSLLTGLALALLGTLGAAAFSLGGGTGARALDGTVMAGASASEGPTEVALTASGTFVVPGTAPKLVWPSSGRAAIEVAGMGLLGHDGSMTASHAIASITKTMTAYVVLKDHPLGPHDQGPTIVVTRATAALYGQAIDRDESALPLRAGERLTERQALEGMLLASAGDFADLLALWDRGSLSAFTAAMNAQARALGLSAGTRYTGPTGLAASTVSTMADQLKLAEVVQHAPVLTAIVAEKSAQVPDVGRVPNVNQDLGDLGIDGIKTGTTAAAGSCLLFSAHVTVGGRRLTLLGIVLGMPGSTGTPWSALKASLNLVRSAEAALRSAVVAAPGAQIAVLERDGSRVARLGVRAPVTVVGWPGLAFRLSVGGGAATPRLTVTQTGGSAAPLTAPLVRLPAAAATPEKSSTPAQSATRAAG